MLSDLFFPLRGSIDPAYVPQIVRLQLERGELVALAREIHSFMLKIIQLNKVLLLLFTYYFEIELLIFKL